MTFFTAPDAPRRHKSYPVTDDDGRRDLLRVRTDTVRHEIEREKLISVLPSRREA